MDVASSVAVGVTGIGVAVASSVAVGVTGIGVAVASSVAVGVMGTGVGVGSSVAVGMTGDGVGAVSVAVGVGGGGVVGSVGVASSGRRQAESSANSSKPHNINLAFIAVLLWVQLFYINISYLASGVQPLLVTRYSMSVS